MAGLLYGSGLRLMECVRLRVKDVDFELAQITVRDAKGGKDRITMLPEAVRVPMVPATVPAAASWRRARRDGRISGIAVSSCWWAAAGTNILPQGIELRQVEREW